METNQKLWNRRQKELRQLLSNADQHQASIRLFLRQHSSLHAPEISQAGLWSYESELLEGLSDEQIRRIPRDGEHSVAWILWHIARIEDVAMNLLVAGHLQIFHGDRWMERMNLEVRDTGNLMAEGRVMELSANIDLGALGAYRMAVGKRTQQIAAGLRPEQLAKKVEPARLEQVTAQGAVVEAANDLIVYWSRRSIAGLLLMPPTRHNFVHLNEASRLKEQLR
jgi:hypothetical protein